MLSSNQIVRNFNTVMKLKPWLVDCVECCVPNYGWVNTVDLYKAGWTVKQLIVLPRRAAIS